MFDDKEMYLRSKREMLDQQVHKLGKPIISLKEEGEKWKSIFGLA